MADSREAATMPVRGAERESEASARAVLDAAMSEAEWQALVIDCAARHGWLVHHQTIPYRRGRDGRVRAIVEPGTHPGFMDLVLVHRAWGRSVMPEVKREGGKLSEAQVIWRDACLAAGLDWRLWFPHDWPEVEATLKGEGG